MKTDIAPRKKTPLPPKLKVNRPSRPKLTLPGSQALKGIEYAVPELRQLISKRWNEYAFLHRSVIRQHVREIVAAVRFHRGESNDPSERRVLKMRLYNATFLKLRELSEGLNSVTLQATGLYRELATECRRLLGLGVDKQTLTRELIESGRTCSRASELLKVCELGNAHFEHFLSGEMSWKLALTTSRTSPEFLEHAATLSDLAASPGPVPPVRPTLHELPQQPLLEPAEREALQAAASHDSRLDFGDTSPLDVPSLPGLSTQTTTPKPLPVVFSVGEQKAVNVAKLRLELVKVAKLSRKSFIEGPTDFEIGGYKISITPIEQ